MKTSPLSELLPLYVAGSLSDNDRRRVEAGLQTSPLLREELAFWQGVQHPARAHDPAHVSAEAMVSYAESTMPAAARSSVEAHLENCLSCRHELEIIRKTYDLTGQAPNGHRPGEERGVWKLSRDFIRTLRRPYAIPATVTVLVAALVLSILVLDRREQPPVTTSRTNTPVLHRHALLLEYVPQLRATHNGNPVKLLLSPEDEIVEISIMVPRSVDSVRYSLALLLPSGKEVRIPELFSPSRHGEDLDSIGFSLHRSRFSSDGRYGVLATEVLPKNTRLTPESYEYSFEVRRANK
jgi:hypothetical protein